MFSRVERKEFDGQNLRSRDLYGRLTFYISSSDPPASGGRRRPSLWAANMVTTHGLWFVPGALDIDRGSGGGMHDGAGIRLNRSILGKSGKGCEAR